MNGVMMPSVSAGSSQREASVMWTPHVMVPSGAAVAGAGDAEDLSEGQKHDDMRGESPHGDLQT